MFFRYSIMIILDDKKGGNSFPLFICIFFWMTSIHLYYFSSFYFVKLTGVTVFKFVFSDSTETDNFFQFSTHISPFHKRLLFGNLSYFYIFNFTFKQTLQCSPNYILMTKQILFFDFSPHISLYKRKLFKSFLLLLPYFLFLILFHYV